jgi:hypothetical protein
MRAAVRHGFCTKCDYYIQRATKFWQPQLGKRRHACSRGSGPYESSSRNAGDSRSRESPVAEDSLCIRATVLLATHTFNTASSEMVSMRVVSRSCFVVLFSIVGTVLLTTTMTCAFHLAAMTALIMRGAGNPAAIPGIRRRRRQPVHTAILFGLHLHRIDNPRRVLASDPNVSRRTHGNDLRRVGRRGGGHPRRCD